MALPAYASLLSLFHLLNNLHYRAPFHLPFLDINLVQTLQQSVQSLVDFVELHHLQTETPEIVHLWRHLAKLAFDAQQIIDSHVVNLLYLRSLDQTSVVDISDFCDDLKRLISKFDTIKKDLQDQIHEPCNKPAVFVTTVAAPSATSSSGKSGVVVGFDDHVISIMDQLTKNQGRLQILPLVGMGGIGKTTLAKCVYDAPYIVEYFDRRIWGTISQEFSLKQILTSLLSLGGDDGTCESSVDVLGQRLCQELFDRRYLVVMDDMWTTEAWDELRRYFPDNENGSRILVTTRDANVAASLGSLDKFYPLSFLDGDASWDLFCQITFGQRGCPYADLEEIGRNIAKSCRGLPLEISVIGRLLANSGMTQEYWEDVGKNISTLGNLEDNDHCFNVLSLSYQSLPVHLKSCFLYLRVFPEDADIYFEELINDWIVEEFIKPAGDKILEEIAEQYLEDLINRSLMFIKNTKLGKVCGVHDLLRDLCLREYIKESFIQSPKVFNQIVIGGADADYCMLCGTSMYEWSDDVSSICGSIVHFPPSSQDDSFAAGVVTCDATCQRKYSHVTNMKLVTIAMAIQMDDCQTKEALKCSTELRSLYFSGHVLYHVVFHQTIHLLWNLEVLKFFYWGSSTLLIPSEIWEMPRLRHLIVRYNAFLANPNPNATQREENCFIVLKDLQTLDIFNFDCNKEVVDRIPNLKSLRIEYKSDESVQKRMMMQLHKYSLCNIGYLQKLESLYVQNAKENISFPNSLRNLRLLGCQIAWEDMSIIGSLPLLEELLLCDVFEGSEWNPKEGEFVQLKQLKIENSNLTSWRAESIHFPVLEKLLLRYLSSLEGIPLGIGDIPTLQLINVENCSENARKCAEEIREEQQEMGNDTLQVTIWPVSMVQRWREGAGNES